MKPSDTANCSGTVKWFSDKRGYGFISANGGQEVFFHQTAILKDGYRSVRKGDAVQFDIVTTPKGLLAENVQLL